MQKGRIFGVKEFFILLLVHVKVAFFDFLEFIRVCLKFYSNKKFAKVDLSLLYLYLFDNPFAISKEFLQRKGEEQIYAYGETPLTTWEKIALQAKITASDTFYELGSGRGRVCFWSNIFLGCKVVGIEQIPLFVQRANSVAQKHHLEGVVFKVENFLLAPLKNATVVYLYGTCLEDAVIEQLAKQLSRLKVGTKIITVSYSLADYLPEAFELLESFAGTFAWGEGNIFIQVVAKPSL